MEKIESAVDGSGHIRGYGRGGSAIGRQCGWSNVSIHISIHSQHVVATCAKQKFDRIPKEILTQKQFRCSLQCWEL